jgi:hypothetical protein
MVRSAMRMLAVAVCLTGISCADDAPRNDAAGDVKAITGLWSGAWGGGGRDGVVFQPVIAELFINGITWNCTASVVSAAFPEPFG